MTATDCNPVLEMEMALLGAMILKPGLETGLTPKHFVREAHTHIFASCESLGQSLDLVTLKEDLAAKGLLESCGDEDYLMQIAAFVPSAENAPFYASKVLSYSKRREARRLGERLIEIADDTESDIRLALERLARRIGDLL